MFHYIKPDDEEKSLSKSSFWKGFKKFINKSNHRFCAKKCHMVSTCLKISIIHYNKLNLITEK